MYKKSRNTIFISNSARYSKTTNLNKQKPLHKVRPVVLVESRFSMSIYPVTEELHE